MKPQSPRVPAHFTVATKQRGISMLITLVALTVLMISAIALVRSFSSSALLSGSAAFKRSSINVGELGFERAMFVFKAGGALAVPSDRYVDLVTSNYYATMRTSDPRGIPDILLNTTAFNAAGMNAQNFAGITSNETISYVIDRQCRDYGSPDPSFCLYVPVQSISDTKGTYNLKKAGFNDEVAYRVTVRVQDNVTHAVTFLQTTLVY